MILNWLSTKRQRASSFAHHLVTTGAKPLFHFYQKKKKKRTPSYHNSPLNSGLYTEEAKDFLISSKKCQLCAPTGFQSPGGAGHQGYHNNLPADPQFNSLLCKTPDTAQEFRFKLQSQVSPLCAPPEACPDLTSGLRNLGRLESGAQTLTTQL